MTLTDAIIVLFLASRIHGSDDAIRRSAKNMAKKLPRSQRDLMYQVGNSKSPSELVAHLATNL